MGVYRVVLSMLLLGTETIRATRETRPKLVHINRLPSDISADAGTTEVERSPLHVAVSGELSGTEALQSDVLCGLALFGGAAFVWQLPVLMDASISVGLRLTKSQSIQASTAIFVAWSIGSMLLGKLADQVGRKTVAVASGWVTVIHLLLISYATSLNHFVLARLLGGFALGGMMQGGFSLAVENVQGALRKSATAANLHYLGTFVTLTIVVVHRLCLMRSVGWRSELRLSAAILAPLVALCGAYVPESPAFLASRAAASQAKSNERSSSNVPPVQLLSYWRPLMRCSFLFMVGALTFYGLNYQAGSISSSLLFNVAVLSLLEVRALQRLHSISRICQLGCMPVALCFACLS